MIDSPGDEVTSIPRLCLTVCATCSYAAWSLAESTTQTPRTWFSFVDLRLFV